MKQAKKGKRGRPPKPVSGRKVSSLTIRLLGELRTKLEEASRVTGRSLSEEVAWRLTMSFMFNTQIEEVSQIQRGLGDAMAEMLTERGWAVGLDEVKRAIDVLFDDPWDKTPIFMPPEVQQLLKEKIHKRTGQSHQEQRAERDEAIDPARVATRPSDATETRTGGDERK